MTAGIVVRHPGSGNTQIGPDYICIKLIKKVQMVTIPELSPVGQFRAHYDFDHTPSRYCFVGFRVGGSAWFMPFWAAGPLGWYHINAPAGTKLTAYARVSDPSQVAEVYIFDQSPPPPSPMTGLLVRNASGDVVFDTEGQIMRVHSTQYAQIAMPPNNQTMDGPITSFAAPLSDYCVAPLFHAFLMSYVGSWTPGSGIVFDDYVDYASYYRTAPGQVSVRLLGEMNETPSGLVPWGGNPYAGFLIAY